MSGPWFEGLEYLRLTEVLAPNYSWACGIWERINLKS